MELLSVKYTFGLRIDGAMRVSIRVLYSTESRFDRNANPPGKGYECSFSSLDEAKSAPFPNGCTLAYIPLDDDSSWTYKAPFKWELHEAIKVKQDL